MTLLATFCILSLVNLCLVTLFPSNGPVLRRTCHAIEVSSLRKTRAVLAASAAAALQLHFVHFLSFSGFALCRAAAAAPTPPHTGPTSTKRFTNLKINLKPLGLYKGAKMQLVSYEFEYF